MDIIDSDSESVGIIIADTEGYILKINENCKKILDIDIKLGDHISQIIDENTFLYDKNNEHSSNYIYKKVTYEQFCFIILFDLNSDSQIQELTEDLNSLLALGGEMISIVDGNGVFREANQAYLDLMNLEREHVVGKSVYSLESNGKFNASATAYALEKKRKVTVTQETDLGKRLIVESFPIFDHAGNIKRVINLARDVTEKENLRRKLKEARKVAEHYQAELQRHINITSMIKTKSMEKVYDLARQVADVDATVLILGESGVGKGVLAKDIHELSQRKENPFIEVNCGAIPESLIESELFGYKGGAFTGASPEGKEGLIVAANNGTLFLDEIGELPLQLQVKLLQVIQEKKVVPLGETNPIEVDVRIITATNRDLKQMVHKGTFRKDLYYRLNVIPIKIPSLAKRKEEIPFFINAFIDNFNDKYNRQKTIHNDAIQLLVEYQWEGNIRELQNMIERLVLTTSDDLIRKEDLPYEVLQLNHENQLSEGGLKEQMSNFEKNVIEQTLRTCKTLKEASEVLGVNISTISRKVRQYNINF